MNKIGQGNWKPPMSGVHPFVRFISENNKMTYQELAKKSGLHYATIQRWRHHGTTPLIGDIEAVLNAMGYDLIIKEREQ